MSDSKTSSRKKKIIRSRYQREREGQKDDPGEKGSDSDWGFSEGEKGMAKITKIVLSLISILLLAFGYLVYQKLTKSEGLFSGSDAKGPMKVAVSENSSKNKGENEFGLGTSADGDNSNVFGLGDSGERTDIAQLDSVQENEDEFFLSDSNAPGENGTPYGQRLDEFNPPNRESSYSVGNTNPRFDSSTSSESFRHSDPSSVTQNPIPAFDQEGSLSQKNEPQNLDESGTGFGVKPLSQQGADQSPGVEMAGDDFSNAFDVAGDVRDADRNQIPQQTEPQQVRDSGNQRFLNKIPDREERNSEQELFGLEDQSAGDTAVQPGQNESNRFFQSPQYPIENNSQNGQADPNAGESFGADVVAENQSRPGINSSIDRDNRFGQNQEPGFAGEAASAKTTTGWSEEPGKISNRFDAPSRFVGASNKNQPGVYEVQSGDNYWSISKKKYGTARYFLALSRYNRQRIPDEKRMRPGMKVLIPSREILQVRNPDLFAKRSAQSNPSQKSDSTTTRTSQLSGFFRGHNREPLYRVGKEDTLSEISQRHLGRSSRWIQIYELNRSRLPSPNNLTIGTVLQLPADASNVRLVKNPQRDR